MTTTARRPSRPSTTRAPLRPREHGAYAMVAFPLLSGLLLGGWTLAGIAFIVVVVTAFLAHESLTVVLGGRGARVAASAGPRARASLVPLGAVALGGGVLFAWAAPSHGLAWASLPGVLGLGVLVMALAGRVKTLVGELLVAGAFASTHLPVAAAGGAPREALWIPSLVWFAGFTLATLTVHSLKYRFKGRGPGRGAMFLAPLLAGAILLAGVVGPLTEPGLDALAALVPVSAVPLGISVVPIHPRNLKRIGWTLVAVDVVALTLLIVLAGG